MLLPRQIGFLPGGIRPSLHKCAELCHFHSRPKKELRLSSLPLSKRQPAGGRLFAHENGRRPNLSADFIRDFCEKLGVKFVPDGLGRPGKREVGPELIFHYAYALFHSPTYRERYAEFLRADFPRLPLTSDFELFRTLAGLGRRVGGFARAGQGRTARPQFPGAGATT